MAAGWHVCNVAQANLHAALGVAIREFPLNNGFGFTDYMTYGNGKACGVIEAVKEGATLTGAHGTSLARMLSVARGKQISIANWARPQKKSV